MKFLILRISLLLVLCFPVTVFAEGLPQEMMGKFSIKEVVLRAQVDLVKNGISSRVNPLKFVVDVIPSSIIHRLIVVENLSKYDMTSGRISWLYEHIGKHGFRILSTKISNANAKGVLQITEGGFDYVSPLYKKAGIGNSFTSAAIDPVTAAKVAILFVDSALAVLRPDELSRVMNDDVLFHDYVASAYNGGITYALRTLRNGKGFINGDKQETRNYVAKMRIARYSVDV